MMAGQKDNGNSWNEWSMHVLKELERLNNNYENISKEVAKTNNEITKVSGLRFAINDLKTWKESLDEVVNKEDLKAMKVAFTESTNQKEEIDELKERLEKALTEVESLNKFKSNTKLAMGILVFLITTAISILAIFLS